MACKKMKVPKKVTKYCILKERGVKKKARRVIKGAWYEV